MILLCRLCGAELPTVLMGEWFDTSERCVECGVAPADPHPALAPSAEEVEYGLDGWPASDRRAVTAGLVEADVPYRWEPGFMLVVPAGTEQQAERLFDEVETAGPPGEAEPGVALDGGEDAQAAMAELFVVADRLRHAPFDRGLAAELAELAEAVNASLPPYGVDPGLWHRIQGLASAAASSALDGLADEDQVAADATALRDMLRSLV